MPSYFAYVQKYATPGPIDAIVLHYWISGDARPSPWLDLNVYLGTVDERVVYQLKFSQSLELLHVFRVAFHLESNADISIALRYLGSQPQKSSRVDIAFPE